MINNSDFADRLKMIMDHNQLSASAFADRIQVQRSSISHLLSGRNKPSLDFVMKVVKEFDEVELYWLLNGKGTYPAGAQSEGSPTALRPEPATKLEPAPAAKDVSQSKDPKNKIERIVVFYTDGTFKAYTP